MVPGMASPTYPTQLFSRLQMKELTGLDDTALNYWSREGVLRPAEGGGGKGQHRRFAYAEINLAAILDQLRQFGVGLPALRRLADRFHVAIDYMASLGVDRLEAQRSEALSELMMVRYYMVREGYFPWRVRPGDRDESLFDGLERHDVWHNDGAYMVHLDWDRAVKLYQSGGRGQHFTDDLAALAATLDVTEYRQLSTYWQTVTHINFQKPDEEVSTEAEYFYRDEKGDWFLTPDNGKAARESISFIGVDVSRLTYRIWVERAGQ